MLTGRYAQKGLAALAAIRAAMDGALPTLFAAAAPNTQPPGYYGPAGFFESKGPPGDAQIVRAA